MRHRSVCGYTLIELLLVLVIVGILATAGVSALGNRPSTAVRGVMDELEGTLASAQKRAVATGRDVMVATRGNWGGTAPSLLMAYGEATDGQATVLANGAADSESFRVATNSGGGLRREHLHAGVVTASNAAWWATALGGRSDITTQTPFNETTLDISGGQANAANPFSGVLTSAPNLFQGGASVQTLRISGGNKRFNATCWIEVVSLSNGQPQPNAPMGLLLVQAASGQIYKFYNPGTLNGGNGQWRRI